MTLTVNHVANLLHFHCSGNCSTVETRGKEEREGESQYCSCNWSCDCGLSTLMKEQVNLLKAGLGGLGWAKHSHVLQPRAMQIPSLSICLCQTKRDISELVVLVSDPLL